MFCFNTRGKKFHVQRKRTTPIPQTTPAENDKLVSVFNNVFNKSPPLHMLSRELDDSDDKNSEDWVRLDVDEDNPEKALQECWKRLPVAMSFEEFKQKMTQRAVSGVDWASWLATLHTLWLVSGYASHALLQSATNLGAQVAAALVSLTFSPPALESIWTFFFQSRDPQRDLILHTMHAARPEELCALIKRHDSL
jgi:hypothetical protein